MVKKTVTMFLVGVLLTFTAVGAQALTPTTYESVFSQPVNLLPYTYKVLEFTPAPDLFTSAFLNLEVKSLANSVRIIGGKTFTSPPSTELFVHPNGEYLFTTDLKVGSNLLDLNNYLDKLNAVQGDKIYLGLYTDRGIAKLSSATLTGTLAPEPVSMALVAAGLAGIPFARRLRKSLT